MLLLRTACHRVTDRVQVDLFPFQPAIAPVLIFERLQSLSKLSIALVIVLLITLDQKHLLLIFTSFPHNDEELENLDFD